MNPVVVAITVLALVLIFALRWSPLRTLGACACVGVVVGSSACCPEPPPGVPNL